MFTDSLPETATKTPDGSVVDADGKVLFFSVERFKKDICLGDCCFICGRSPTVTDFNDEHIIPNWILKRYKMHSWKIELPNGQTTDYGSYKVPCCVACNSALGKYYETPISTLTKGGFRTLSKYGYLPHVYRHLFSWLALIFLKTHLKDKLVPMHRDPRKGDERIAHEYTWEQMHHIHCVARAFYTGAQLERGVLGSFAIFQAMSEDGPFDYKDLTTSESLLLRIGNVCLVSNLTDSGVGQVLAHEILSRAATVGKLSRVQLREILAHFALKDLSFGPRPQFLTVWWFGLPRIRVDLAEKGYPLDPGVTIGEMTYGCVKDILEDQNLPNRDRIAEDIRKGLYAPLKQTWDRSTVSSLATREKKAVRQVKSKRTLERDQTYQAARKRRRP